MWFFMGKGRLCPPGRQLERQTWTSHLPPRSSPTRDRAACESAPATGRWSAGSLFHHPGPLKETLHFPDEETAPATDRSPPRFLITGIPRHTYTSERPASSTASEQSSLTEARRGTLGTEGEGCEGQNTYPGPGQSLTKPATNPYSKVTHRR